METEGDSVPSYLQPDKDPDLDSELNLPTAPTGHAPVANQVFVNSDILQHLDTIKLK